MTLFVVRAKQFKEALADPAFADRWNGCLTVAARRNLFAAWCRTKGYTVVDVPKKLWGLDCNGVHPQSCEGCTHNKQGVCDQIQESSVGWRRH